MLPVDSDALGILSMMCIIVFFLLNSSAVIYVDDVYYLRVFDA